MGLIKDPPILQPQHLFDDDILSVLFFSMTQVVLLFSIKTALAQVLGLSHLYNYKSPCLYKPLSIFLTLCLLQNDFLLCKSDHVII